MAEYVVPNTTIYIIKDCPCEPDYKNTMYFGTKTYQFATFSNWIKYTLNEYSYQRYGAGRIQVEIPVENLYDCNYLIFQNTGFKDSEGNVKKFYAFITDVEYVNPTTSTITYEIDVIQTWLGDYELQEVMVEREHTLTDVPGDNIVPEPFGNLPMVKESDNEVIAPNGTRLSELNIVGWFASNTNVRPAMGLPTMLTWAQWPYTQEGIKAFNTAMEDLDPKNLIALHLAPRIFMPATNRPVEPWATDWANQASPNMFEFNVDRDIDVFHQSINGVSKSYTPRNKKLLTAPYYSLYIASNDGKGKNYPFEFSGRANGLYFRVVGSFTANPIVTVIPLAYKGTTENYEESFSLSGYPQCSTDNDAYKAWLAQRDGAISVQAIGGVATAVASALTQNWIGAIGGAFTLFNAWAQRAGAAELPNSGSTGGGSGESLAAAKKLTLRWSKIHVTVEDAKRIDDYFNRYGYAVMQVKKPNIGTRPFYNYVKTQNCAIHGSIPASAEKRICEVYDKGITFWKTTGHFGDYSVDNSPGATNPEYTEEVS